MARFAVTGSKGGAGKTTVALMLALGLASGGRRVLLVDADRNAPLVRWSAKTGAFDGVSVAGLVGGPDLSALTRTVRKHTAGERYDDVIVDTAADAYWAPVCALWAQTIIAPLTASPMDVQEALQTIDRVRRTASIYGVNPRTVAVLCRLSAAIRPRLLRSAIERLDEADVALLDTALFEKEAFRLVFASGGDLDTAARTASARANRDALTTDVLRFAARPDPVPSIDRTPPAWMRESRAAPATVAA